ncbi:MAG: hypothetical protein ACK5XT_09150 [Gemmatimonas sp.]|uniref:hypothetical protein n=1 Tax=Gemmatimonas sp. TaxID=1962908 RepID=UPI00391F3497
MPRPLPPTPPAGRDNDARSGSGGNARRRPERGALGKKLVGLPKGEQRSPRALAVAVGLHLAVGAVLVQVLTFGHGMPAWFDFGGPERAVEERLTYVSPTPAPPEPPRTTATEAPRRSRPSAVPATPPAPPEALPSGVPAGAPPAAVPRDTGSGGARANGVGALDPNVRGVRPGYTDERVWRGPVGASGGAGGTGTGDRADNIGEIMRGALMAAQDSVDSLARVRGDYGRQPGDWTKTDKNGGKWGWDQQGIRLGKVMIPNALLGLLPLNAGTAASMSANPTAMSREARLSQSRADIMRMSERGMGEAEFKRVVKEMDARRDTERRERLRAPSASVAAPVKSSDKGGN